MRKHTIFTILPSSREIQISGFANLVMYQYTPSFSFSGEFHSQWEFVYVDIGSVSITAEDQSFVLEKGQFFLHKPNEFHTIRANNTVCNVGIIAFELSAGNDILMNLAGRVACAGEMQLVLLGELFALASDALSQVHFNEDVLNPPEQFGVLQLACNLLESFFLIELRRQFQKDTLAVSPSDNPIVRQMIQYIHTHRTQNITVKELAVRLNYHESYLSRLFFSATGKTFTDYCIDLRLEQAKLMMTDRSTPLYRIATELGFSSQQYFCKLFKKRNGISPSKYRTSLLAKQRFDIDKK